MDLRLWLYVLVIIIIAAFIYKHLTRHFNHWKDQGVPFVPPIPLFGNLLGVVTLKKSLGQLAKEVYDHADSRYTGFFIFDQPFLLIRDPDLIKNILIRDFEHFNIRTAVIDPKIDEVASNLLAFMRNPAWRPVRVKLTPLFTSGKMKNMLHLMLEVGEDLKSYIGDAVSSDGVIESRELSMRYTTDVISSCAFGINSHSFKHEDAEFRVAARRFFDVTITRSMQIAAFFVAPGLAKLCKIKVLDQTSEEFLRSVFCKHMRQRKESNVKRGDMIDILLQIEEDNVENSLDGEVLVAQAIQFFLAGFETTGGVISFALYELALNSNVQNRLSDEIKTILEKHGRVSYEAVMDMKYLDNVIHETLRKYPPLTLLDRRCTKTYQIPDSNLTIETGTPIYISLFGLHMDAKYFPEPDKFDPDRFSDLNKDSILPFTYLPFGDGPRNCIGERFGLLSAKLALITILNHFEVCPDVSTPVPMKLDPKSGVLIAPDGGVVNLRYKRRS